MHHSLLCAAHSNDGFDAQTGVDLTKPESLVNITGNRAAVLAVAWVAFAVGVSLLSSAMGAANDARIPAQLGAAIACGYVYQGPPFRYVRVCFFAARLLAIAVKYRLCYACAWTLACTARQSRVIVCMVGFPATAAINTL